jgi:serine/threonine-protein kinase
MSIPDLPGTILGGYEIRALLGSGGMASVYRGFDPNLQRPVAIKVLASAAAAIPGFAERFRQEARLIANLRHPHIVQVYDFGEQQGLTYMVQELLPGPTLEQYMADLAARGTPLPPAKVVKIISQLASALDAAHAAGVIHRDVKPGNALWNATGALVLTDFGIAKNIITPNNQTQAGLVMGTPAYMSPEQAQGLTLTPASDIYALGVVLYELITGKVPFEGTTPMGVVLQHIQSPPPPLHPHRPDVPPEVEAVVQRALDKEPGARFASASAMAQALQQAWPVTPRGAAVAINDQPTQIWSNGSVAAPPVQVAAVPARSSAAPGPTPRPDPVPAVQASPGAAVRRPPLVLLGLGGLLALMLLAGTFLTLRPAGTVADRPTDIQPTAAPQVTATVVPAATALPPAATDAPVAQLRALFDAGAPDLPAGQGDALRTALDDTQRALAEGETERARARLVELQRELLRGARAREIEPRFVRQALTGISAVAERAGLTLPLSVSSE